MMKVLGEIKNTVPGMSGLTISVLSVEGYFRKPHIEKKPATYYARMLELGTSSRRLVPILHDHPRKERRLVPAPKLSGYFHR
jgi:hypothetical protein